MVRGRSGGPLARALIAIALAATVAACTVDPIDPDGRACPCVAGWVCDDVSDRCVRIADAGTRDASDRDAPPGIDSGPRDSGPRDAGPRDAGPGDAGPEDAGPTDAGFDATVEVDACMPETEVCDGDDDDCDGMVDEDACGPYDSCADALAQGRTASGVLPLDPEGTPVDVWCDQTTDGGGWTLVASTLTTMPSDEATGHHADLATLAPAAGHRGIWNGLRSLGTRFDLRFACRATVGAAGAPFDVDLSFYDVIWYDEITTGTEAESCFSEGNGAGADPPPARRDNIAGTSLPAGDTWNTGYFEGEDNCNSGDDFTVDFDNRGMDDNQSDGTDWGEDDLARKCGTSGLMDGQWFLFARER